MRSVSEYYKQKIANGDTRIFHVKIDLTLADGTVFDGGTGHYPSITDADILSDSFKLLSASSGDSSFDIGSAIIGKCEFSLINFDDQWLNYDFFNATAVVWVKLDGDSEYHRIGFYTVDEPVYAGSIVQLELLDNMYLFDRPLEDVGLTFPVKIGMAVQAVCTHCGVVLDDPQFHCYAEWLYKEPEDDMSCREFIQYCAMWGCNFCTMTSTGSLSLRWYNTSSSESDGIDGGTFLTNSTPYSDGDDADGGDFNFNEVTDYDGGTFTENTDIAYFTRLMSRNIQSDEIIITGVKIVIDETEYKLGYEVVNVMPTASSSYVGTIYEYGGTTTSSYTNGCYYKCVEKNSSYEWQKIEEYTLVLENPLVRTNDADLFLYRVWEVLEGTVIRAFSVMALPDIAPEIGDRVAISYKGNMVYSYLTNYTFTPTLSTASLGCVVPSRTLEYRPSKAVQAAVEAARKNTTEIISEYDNLVQLMNSIAVNAIGGYEDYEDLTTGGRVWYVSNRPITKVNNVCSFVEGSTVFKKTGEGFFVSTDGGETFTNGYDAGTGLLVVNILSAIGVVADWVRTGRIEDEVGRNFWDLDTGELRMTSGARINLPNTDYAGAVDPTLNNAPASGWTGHYDDHIGETYTNTRTKQTFKFVNNNAVKLHFNSQSQTEGVNFDWVYICYTKDGVDYGLKLGGDIGEQDIYVPSADFDIQWRTDHNVYNYYGFRIDSMELATGTTSFSVISEYPSGEFVPIYGTDEIIESSHPYTNNAEILYIVQTGLTLGYMWEEVTTTLDDYTSGVIDEDVDYQKIMYELTGGGEDQGIYNHNGKVYINAQYLKAYSINAKDVAFGTMLFDRSSGGILALGGASNADGKLIITDTPYNSSSGSISAGSSATRTFIPNVDGKLWLNISSSAPSETACGTWQKSGESPKALYNGENYLGIYLAEETYLYTINADYALSYTEVRADALVTAGNFGIKTSEITATGGHIGGFILTQNELYKLGTYVIFGAKNYRIKYKSVSTTKNIKYFYPNKLDVQDSEFGLSIIYTVDTTMAWSGSQVFLYLEKKVGSSYVSVGDIIPLQYTQGTYTASFNYTFSNADSTKYRVCMHYYEYVDSHNITITFVSEGVRVVSLKDESIWGNHRGSFFGTGTFDSASITNLESEEIRVTDDYNDKEIVTTPTEITKYDGSSYYVAQWQSASDERVKEDVESLDVDLSKNLIDATQPKRFKYKNAEGIHYGMIAQETRELLDNLGETEATLERSLGLPDELSGIEDERMIDYMEYTAHIINYVKDLRAELNQVKAELNELNRVKTELEAELNELKEGK